MRSFFRPILAAVALLASATVLAEASIVGTWRGSLSITVKSLSAGQERPVESQLNIAKDAVIQMTINRGGTYTASWKGISGQKDKSEKGTWKLKGDKVTFHNTTKREPDATLIVSKDGKTMSTTLPKTDVKLVFLKL